MIDVQSLYAAKLKYRQLSQEIGQVSDVALRSNMFHSHSKLGIFLEAAVGVTAWRAEPLSGILEEGEEV